MGTVTKTIGSAGGRDYSTIALWAASLPANLVTDGNSYVGQMYNDSEFSLTSTLSFSGNTTDSTHTITLTTGPGQSFRDNPNVQKNALKYNQANGVGIASNTNSIGFSPGNNCFLTNFQVRNNTEGDSNFNLGSGPTIQNLIVKESITLPIAKLGNARALNCLFYNDYTGSAYIANVKGLFGSNPTIINCTIAFVSDGHPGSGPCFNGIGGANNVRNNAFFGFGTASSGFAPEDHNGSDQTLSGTGDKGGLTYTSQFVSTTSANPDFRLVSGSTLVDNATTDSSDIPTTDDIAGTQRPQGSGWDIGAWEFVPIPPDAGSSISAGYWSKGKWHALKKEVALERRAKADKDKKEREAERREAALTPLQRAERDVTRCEAECAKLGQDFTANPSRIALDRFNAAVERFETAHANVSILRRQDAETKAKTEAAKVAAAKELERKEAEEANRLSALRTFHAHAIAAAEGSHRLAGQLAHIRLNEAAYRVRQQMALEAARKAAHDDDEAAIALILMH